MPEKYSNSFNFVGIRQRLFNFFLNSLIACGLKRVTLGQPLPQGYDHPLRPSKPNEEMMVHYKDHENSKHDSRSEIEVLFKQSEKLESWTPVDPVASKSERPAGHKMGLPLVQEKIEPQVQGKSSQVVLSRSGPRKTVTVKGSEKEDRSKMKGKSIPSENLTLAIADEEPKWTPRRLRPSLSVAPNINEKSDEFIRSRKEAMSRNMGMKPKKKSESLSGELELDLS